MNAALRTGELADLAGVNIQTLRYYERRGLLPEPDRSLGGHRQYPPEAVAHVKIIKAAQRLGFTLREIHELLAVAGHRHRSHPNLQQRAAAKLGEVRARIADLETIRDTLIDVISAGCDDLANCTSPGCPLPLNDLAAVPGRNQLSEASRSTDGNSALHSVSQSPRQNAIT